MAMTWTWSFIRFPSQGRQRRIHRTPVKASRNILCSLLQPFEGLDELRVVSGRARSPVIESQQPLSDEQDIIVQIQASQPGILLGDQSVVADRPSAIFWWAIAGAGDCPRITFTSCKGQHTFKANIVLPEIAKVVCRTPTF